MLRETKDADVRFGRGASPLPDGGGTGPGDAPGLTRIPIRAIRIWLVRLIALRRALSAIASMGGTGRHARLLAREMAERARG